MSYILDALRKSDQQRQHGAAPTLSSVQFPAAERRQRNVWLSAIAIGLLAAGILIGWWQPWQPPHSQPPAPSASSPPQDAPPPRTPAERAASDPATPAAAALPQPALPSQDLTRSGMPAEPLGNAASPAISQALPPTTPERPAADEAQRPNRTGGAAAGRERVVEKKPASEPAAAAEQSIMSWAELPASVQQELPKFSVSLHAYSSKPGNRLVSINDQLLHEGESLSPGLVVEQIRPDDMVLSYKGFRFRQGVQ